MATYTAEIDLALLPHDADRIRVRLYVGEEPDVEDGTVEVDYKVGAQRTGYPLAEVAWTTWVEDENGRLVVKHGKGPT